MATGTALDSEGALTPDACRRFFFQRGDISLGLVPQLLLDDRRSDLWSYFWYAARVVDDEIEAGRVDAEEYARRLQAGSRERPEEEALARFFEGLSTPSEVVQTKAELTRALSALGRERGLAAPPALSDYSSLVVLKAGVPLGILGRLMFPGEPAPSLQRFTTLLALSIQIGDDLRDRARDQQRGIQTWAREELEAARAQSPADPDAAVRRWREAASQWLGLLALERADRFQSPENRTKGRIEAMLWLRAIELGQLRNTSHPLKWPAPLGDLLAQGPPSAARMAAARRVVLHEPALLGNAKRWEPPQRVEEHRRLKASLPPVYLALEHVAT